jgi:hypothetical protein
MDADKRLIMLSAGREVGRNELEARKRRFWNRVNWIVVPLGVIIYWLIRGF